MATVTDTATETETEITTVTMTGHGTMTAPPILPGSGGSSSAAGKTLGVGIGSRSTEGTVMAGMDITTAIANTTVTIERQGAPPQCGALNSQ